MSSFIRAVVLSALLLNAPNVSFGQALTVKGQVTDYTTLQPLRGVSVIEGDTIRAVTDAQGRFSIGIPQQETTLLFDALGYARQERTITGDTVVNVALEPVPIPLEELVVVEYSRQNRATISGRVGPPDSSRDPSGTLSCDGAALSAPPTMEPQSPPLQMPAPEVPPTQIPNGCAAPTTPFER